ncbi:MAG: cystathionine beta-lyase [Caulobacteraceae bacterium]|nr:cystathionine beta-lyase [Caulobacteraceae bacterium]
MHDETRLIRAGAKQPLKARTVGPAVQKGSTVLLPNAEALYDHSRQTYGREGLAAQRALEEGLCALEAARRTFLYPSGLAAVTGAMLALLRAGDEVLVVDSIYRPTRRFCDHLLARYGVNVRYYDPLASAEEVMALCTPATRLIAMESPGSLTFEMQDVPAIARLARAQGIATLMDNTWGAGLTFRPLTHGVDVSVQALTKYVGGHSDVFMGSAAVSDAGLAAQLEAGQLHMGWAVTGEDAYQMLRGLRTLPTRMARHEANGLEVARWLEARPEVLEVIHPALPGARGHDLWARDFTGACGLFAFVLQPAPEAAVHAFLDALKLFGLGFSWGGFESLAIHCHPQLGEREHLARFDGPLIRLHVGLEASGDLVDDLAAGFAAFEAHG